jgi:hypothetical protein
MTGKVLIHESIDDVAGTKMLIVNDKYLLKKELGRVLIHM